MAATTLNDLTGLNLSHESVWRIVQNAGSWEQTQVEALAMAAKAERGAGVYETLVLYEEMDGVYLTLQGKDQREHSSSKEMKVAIAYFGIHTSGQRSLANSVAGANNLAALLALHHTGHLRRVLREWTVHGAHIRESSQQTGR